jgi:hypothetical protein
MGDNGWFTTAVMYAGMALSALSVPFRLATKLVQRYPKYTLNVVLAAGSALCFQHSLHHKQNAPLYTWAGVLGLVATLVMVFFVAEQPEPRRTVRVPNPRDNWFHD